MNIIEPCCASRQFGLLRDAIGNNKRTQFKGFGDMSLTELLPALLLRYTETEMMIVAPSIPDQATTAIREWLRKTWARWDNTGRLDCISKLTIIADFSEDASPMMSAWLKENPFAGKLTLVNQSQEDTAILLPDLAITGPLNFQYDKEFVCDVTAIPSEVNDLWARYAQLMRKRNTKKKVKKDSASSVNDSASSTGSTTYAEPESTNITVSADKTEPVQVNLSESSTAKETED